MTNKNQKTEDSNWHEHKMFKDGYGKFPYVILKVGYALFMQIPIHFNKNNLISIEYNSLINKFKDE